MSEETRSGNGWLSRPQRRLGTAGTVALMAAINTLCPFAIDMFSPALPSMPAYFDAPEAVVNLTVSTFVLFLAAGMLVFGPVSDRVGRKPILVAGMAAFSLASALCIFVQSIWLFIVLRAVQALGAGAVCAVSTAVVKDCFLPEKRTQLLSVLQVLMVIGPVAAPILGGLLLNFAEWPVIFVALTAVALFCLALSLLFEETLPAKDRSKGLLLQSIRDMKAIASNRGFAVLLVIVSLFAIPYMAYIGVGSYVYIDHFGTTAQVYSYFFAATAGIAAVGPILYLKLSRFVSPRSFTWGVLVLCLGLGAVLLTAGVSSIWVFFVCLATFVTAEAAIRPYCTNALLSLSEKDVGSASSLINFANNVIGVPGMWAISLLPVSGYAFGLGALVLASMGAATALWIYLLRSDKASIPEFEK